MPVLCAMERTGVAIDSARMGEIAARVSEQVEALEQRAHELAGGPFVLGSPKQLGEVLFERLELPAGRRGKTGYSTDSKVLAKLRDLHAIVPVIEEWRELSKLLSTYLLPFPELLGEDGRLHTTFSQVTAATGRLSAQRPNLQNIPIRTPLGRELRATFVAAPGHRLLSVDYSQVELRILAHLSGEELLREAFGRGEDIHAVTAAEVLGKAREELSKDERNRAKAVNFGIIYGISAHGLSEQLEITRDEAQAYIDTYRGRMPLVAEFIERAIGDARERGYAVTLLGRRRPIPELRAQGWNVRSLGERLAVNTVIQGSAADIIKLAMVRDPPAARRGGARRPPGAADPRRAAARGARHGDDRRARAGRGGDGAAPTRWTRPWRSTAASATTGSRPKARHPGAFSPSTRRPISRPSVQSASKAAPRRALPRGI